MSNKEYGDKQAPQNELIKVKAISIFPQNKKRPFFWT